MRKLYFCCVFFIAGASYAAETPDDARVLADAKDLVAKRDVIEARLIALLQQEDRGPESLKRKCEAALLLGKIGGLKAVAALISCINDYFDPIKNIAVDHDGLGNTPPTPAMLALVELGPIAIEPLIASFLAQDPKGLVGRAVGQTLERFRCKDLVIAAITGALHDKKNDAKKPMLEDLLSRVKANYK